MSRSVRLTFLGVAVALAFGQSGCATVIGALAGAALCGDSSDCQRDFVEAGAVADVAIASSVIHGAVDGEEGHPLVDAEPEEYTSGGEMLLVRSDPDEVPPEAQSYYHCVDTEGHHVVELVAPSALEARYVCLTELGFSWSDPRAAELCSCRSLT